MLALERRPKRWGFSITTLRRGEREGKLISEHTFGGRRRYNLAKMCPEYFRAAPDVTHKTVAYARVSSHDQKDDLKRQKPVLERYCARPGLEVRGRGRSRVGDELPHERS